MKPRFVLDAHLGGLAAYLRMLGYDTLWWHDDVGDDELARLSREEGRVLLSRDRPLLARADVGQAMFVRAGKTRVQLREVVAAFGLLQDSEPFTRCMECNSTLESLPKESARGRVLQDTFLVFEEFFECPGCRRVYWKGSHYERMASLIEELKRGAAA